MFTAGWWGPAAPKRLPDFIFSLTALGLVTLNHSSMCFCPLQKCYTTIALHLLLLLALLGLFISHDIISIKFQGAWFL